MHHLKSLEGFQNHLNRRTFIQNAAKGVGGLALQGEEFQERIRGVVVQVMRGREHLVRRCRRYPLSTWPATPPRPLAFFVEPNATDRLEMEAAAIEQFEPVQSRRR